MTSAAPHFGRMIPAMVTPFAPDGSVDFKQAQKLADFLVEGGSDSLLVCGTTGESPTVSKADKLGLFRAVVEAVAGRVPVIANVGGNSTSDSIDFAREAAGAGVDGIMAVVPYYNKPPQEGMFAHFSAIAGAVDLPMILYNIPGRCGVNMTDETTLRLARERESIVAVKEASGDLDQIKRIIDRAPEGFAVYSGDDALMLDVMRLGGVGVISTSGNVIPSDMKRLTELCACGSAEEAEALNERLMPLMKGLFATSNPILVKAALNLMGLAVGGVRLPLVEATDSQIEELRSILRLVGALPGE